MREFRIIDHQEKRNQEIHVNIMLENSWNIIASGQSEVGYWTHLIKTTFPELSELHSNKIKDGLITERGL